ncbi:hypothetical protein ACE6H2_020477 [Prunus campanulata]
MSRARKGTSRGASSSGSAPQPEEAILTATVVTERNLDLSPSIQTTALIQEPRDNEEVPLKVRGKNFVLSTSIISEVLHIPEKDTYNWRQYLLRDFDMQSAAETLFYDDPAAFASQTRKTVLIQGVRARSNDIFVEPMGPISDTSVSKSISQRRNAHAPAPAPMPPHMPPPPPHRPASSQPFPPAPSVDTSAWEPPLQAIWDLQMLQYQQVQQQQQQMQHMSTSIDAIWTHLQMPGQPGTAAHDDVVDDDDEADE